MIEYWTLPDGRSGLVPATGTLALPDDGQRHTVPTPDDLPPALREEYDATPAEAIPSRDDAVAAAHVVVVTAHAAYLNTATGGATIEERDTWKPKEEAARAYIAGTATEPQTTMIEGEAAGDDTAPVALAQGIVAKADGFMRLIGRAGNLRARAQAALDAIPEDAAPGEAQTAVAAALADMQTAMQGAPAPSPPDPSPEGETP